MWTQFIMMQGNSITNATPLDLLPEVEKNRLQVVRNQTWVVGSVLQCQNHAVQALYDSLHPSDNAPELHRLAQEVASVASQLNSCKISNAQAEENLHAVSYGISRMPNTLHK
jgi:hypothetical protein